LNIVAALFYRTQKNKLTNNIFLKSFGGPVFL
jgi:hypothetical protein